MKQILQNHIQNRDVDAGEDTVGLFLADHAGRRLALIYIRVCVFLQYLALSVWWLPLISDIWSPW